MTPDDIPEPSPVTKSIESMSGVVEVQNPPGVASVDSTVVPTHKTCGPPIGAGTGLTVKVIDDEQPVGKENTIVVTPAEMPVTMPEVAPTVATEGEVLVHVPKPPAANIKVTSPTHSELTPLMGPGNGFTVTGCTAVQPSGSV